MIKNSSKEATITTLNYYYTHWDRLRNDTVALSKLLSKDGYADILSGMDSNLNGLLNLYNIMIHRLQKEEESSGGGDVVDMSAWKSKHKKGNKVDR